MSKRPTIEVSYKTLGEWAADRADLRIVCACGRTMNMPSEEILGLHPVRGIWRVTV